MIKDHTKSFDKTFKLHAIGSLHMQKKGAIAYIAEEFRPALKHLKLFSHALIFFLKKERYRRDLLLNLALNKSQIDFITVKVLEIDEVKGILKLGNVEEEINTVIFDIKPYFPCEDRVEKVCLPEAMKSEPKWKREISLESSGEYYPDFINESDRTDNFQAYPIGQIRKIEGEAFLEFFDEEKGFFETLKDFSHLRIMWWFDKFDKSRYRKVLQSDPPYENAPRTGIFATRSPVRPNPIALTTVKLLNLESNNKRIRVSELDALDKTPIIAVRPYRPCYDRIEKFDVPKWLSHWPEWTNDTNDTNHASDINEKESELLDAHLEPSVSQSNKIQSFMIRNLSTKEEIEGLFKESKAHTSGYLEEIVIKGARQNNLKNISLTIPKNKITVVTGVSGSGKSSLAFDTLYAESQRRFMDSLSSSSGMLTEQMEKPDIDQIIGLPPAIAVEQKSVGRNPRSTVGTSTDLYDYVKLLFSKIGERYCPECKKPINALSPKEIEDLICSLLPGTRLTIKTFQGEPIITNLEVPETEIQEESRDARAVFIKAIREGVKEGLDQGKGAIHLILNSTEAFLLQSTQMCYHCNKILFELTPSVFSFNNPESMCPVCKGLGVKLEVAIDLIVEHPHLSLLDEASSWWGNLRKHREKPNANWMKGELLALAKEMQVDLELPWHQLPPAFKEQAIFGSKGKSVNFTYENTNGRKGEITRPVEGAYHIIKRLFRENGGATATKIAQSFMRQKKCPECHGERLAAEGRLVTVAHTRFPETIKMTLTELKKWVLELPQHLTKEQLQIAVPILQELNRRVQNLIDVGLSYLSLDRAAPTLSGGEAQRLRLAAQLSSGLTHLLYILDEPSIGLHPKDHQHLIKTIKRIKAEGNTVVIVEHDREIMLAADHIIDIGPGAGVYGGSLVAKGTPQEIVKNPDSLTGKYLSGKKTINTIAKDTIDANACISIIGASQHNLKNIEVSFPIGRLTCVTGVSGSGKSTLISQTLYPAIAKFLHQEETLPGAYEKIEGLHHIDKVINISQLPIGRTPRSNPATYTGVFEQIRDLFAKTPEAKARGYKANRFSFNSKEGQCESCNGEGRRCTPMHFMPDVWTVCPSCHGKRFKPETLEITYNEVCIADILDMNIEKACNFFKEHTKIMKILQTLQDVGLGYLKLGQSALTLSGGEAQRVKLAKELSKTDTGKTLYILDEPTTGLHFLDVQNLLNILKRITELGNTVIVIEHNLDIIQNADWLIDLGPEGGDKGGYLVAKGTPQEVATHKKSYTGAYLFHKC